MLKKLLLLSLAVCLLVGVSHATKVDFIPTPGIQIHGTATEEVGKIFIGDNGNVWRKVYNDDTNAADQADPAFYVAAVGNSWTVKSSYEATADLEKFAGIWYCDADGNTDITASEYGWIQIAGRCVAAVEGVTDIDTGDLLVGTISSESHLIYGRDEYTAMSVASSEVTYLTVPGPIATVAYATDSTGTTEVFLKGLY